MSMYRPNTGDNELNQSLYGWQPETEIRFVVDELDWSIIAGYANPNRIEQAYFGTPAHISQRIRIVNQDIAVLTKKTGWGETRGELEVKQIDPKLARVIHDELCLHAIVKTRYNLVGGWSLDVYERPHGLVIAEYEGVDAINQRNNLPSWLVRGQEITNIATNAEIARWTHEHEVGLLQCSVREMLTTIPQIVLAGGPGSGKSTLFAGLRKQLARKATFVVEAARMLIETAGHQPPVGNQTAMNRFERGIYDAHKLLVGMAEDEARRVHASAIISDRHQVDVFVYLDSDQNRFEQVCNTKLAYEYTKGDLVFYCAMPTRAVYESLCMGDGVRWEDYDQAMAIDARLRSAYAGFGERVVEVPFCASKEEKLRGVFWQIKRFLGLT